MSKEIERNHRMHHENQKLMMSKAKSSIDNAEKIQSMRIKEANAELDIELKKLEIVKKHIEIARDLEELKQFKNAYNDYQKKIQRLKKKILDAERTAERIQFNLNRARFILDGEFTSKRMVRHSANSMLILFREFVFDAIDSRIILNSAIKKNELPNIGSEEYNKIVSDLISLGTHLDQAHKELESSISKNEESLKSIQSMHWKKVGVF